MPQVPRGTHGARLAVGRVTTRHRGSSLRSAWGGLVGGRGYAEVSRAARPLIWWPRTRRPHRSGELGLCVQHWQQNRNRSSPLGMFRAAPAQHDCASNHRERCNRLRVPPARRPPAPGRRPPATGTAVPGRPSPRARACRRAGAAATRRCCSSSAAPSGTAGSSTEGATSGANRECSASPGKPRRRRRRRSGEVAGHRRRSSRPAAPSRPSAPAGTLRCAQPPVGRHRPQPRAGWTPRPLATARDRALGHRSAPGVGGLPPPGAAVRRRALRPSPGRLRGHQQCDRARPESDRAVRRGPGRDR
ncbi:MAG: hypothetical protein JWO98_4581 [Frankiales bacterium]|nr:hypothetical protein [Frankiales bacterium]